jgi:hypothetical protein
VCQVGYVFIKLDTFVANYCTKLTIKLAIDDLSRDRTRHIFSREKTTGKPTHPTASSTARHGLYTSPTGTAPESGRMNCARGRRAARVGPDDTPVPTFRARPLIGPHRGRVEFESPSSVASLRSPLHEASSHRAALTIPARVQVKRRVVQLLIGSVE